MDVVGLNRVELVIDQARIHDAVEQFNEAFGLRLPEPIPISGHGALSATDFERGLEFIAPHPDDTTSSVGRRLAEFGEGQLGPLVFEIRDVEQARSWLEGRGFRIRYEYDSRQGNADEAEMAVHQLHLDPEQWFGFNVTLMRRFAPPPTPVQRNKQVVRDLLRESGLEARTLTAEDDRVAATATAADGTVSHHLFVLTVDGRIDQRASSEDRPTVGSTE